jgi:bifunctional oligoribonuclease and PAP phosphatase NrnA
MDHHHELIETIHDQLHRANDILIVSHLRPDGDAIGSVLALGLALLELKKHVQMVLSDGVPENFQFLTGSELITNRANGKVDYIIVVDSPEVERTDEVLRGFDVPDLNIDHHKTNSYFGKLNLVVQDASATSELLAKYMPGFGLPITPAIANALLTGVVTDTIGFRTTNVTSPILRLIADLMDSGGNLANVYFKTIVEQSLPAARYWGAGLSKIEMKDGLVWTTLSLKERNQAGYLGKDDADLIKIISAIEGARVAIILTEQSSGYVKISWRLCGSTFTDLDVSEMAKRFGGGGHKAAAGADVKGKLSDVLAQVLVDTRVLMEQVDESFVRES